MKEIRLLQVEIKLGIIDILEELIYIYEYNSKTNFNLEKPIINVYYK